MNSRRAQMLADRQMRDSARALIKSDISHLKGDLDDKGVSERVVDRAKEGALDIYEDSIDIAMNNKGMIAAFLAAGAIWLARGPIFSLFGGDADEGEDDDEEV